MAHARTVRPLTEHDIAAELLDQTRAHAAERGPGQGLWYNDFCVFGVAAMSRGSLPGLFWRHPTEEEPWAR
jgi:hypothetical protein